MCRCLFARQLHPPVRPGEKRTNAHHDHRCLQESAVLQENEQVQGLEQDISYMQAIFAFRTSFPLNLSYPRLFSFLYFPLSR